jgi:hypothetical protein
LFTEATFLPKDFIGSRSPHLAKKCSGVYPYEFVKLTDITAFSKTLRNTKITTKA